MRKRSLVPKLIFTLSITLCLSFFLTGAIISYLLEANYFSENKSKLDSGSSIIEKKVISFVNNDYDTEEQLPITLNLMSRALEADIFVLDDYGYVYSVSNQEYNSLKFKKFNNIDIKDIKNNKYLERKSDNYYIYCKPVFDNGSFIGGIVFATPLNVMKSGIKAINKIIWMSVIIAVILTSTILYYVSRKVIIKPLDRINNAAKRLANGEIGNRVEVIHNDEIGELAESFNIMAKSLEEAEMSRREFISNISHELRSPITSVKGFITAILDGVIPKDKQEYYLKIANDEILRLTRLINDLLELSTMQAGKMTFSFTEIDINHLIKSTAIKMQQKMVEKNIKTEILLESSILYVYGDSDKIIQVLTNLLDNAIKYCYNDGEIKLTSKSKGDKVVISIYNNGPSIAKEDVNYIWDRFYKADKSRTNKTSTGLGLAIVRNIVIQHGEDIWIENGSGGIGVTFSFTLSKTK